jgi:hypothetical protein
MVVEARARRILLEAGHAVCDPQACQPWQWPFAKGDAIRSHAQPGMR